MAPPSTNASTGADGLFARARAQYRTLSASEGATAGERGALLVDIRPAGVRQRNGSIPGAVVVERNVLEWRLDPAGEWRLAQLDGPDREVVLFCNEGYASALAVPVLRSIGLAHATDLADGFRGWREAGLPIVVPRAPEHPVTARLRGEPLVPEHVEVVRTWWEDPKVNATLGGPRTVEHARRQTAASERHWSEHGYGTYLWHDAASGEPVAWGGLRHDEADGSPELELLYTVAPTRWGQGLASELATWVADLAVGPLGLDDVVAFTLHDNVGSRRVMERAGLTYEKDIERAGLAHVLHRRHRLPA